MAQCELRATVRVGWVLLLLLVWSSSLGSVRPAPQVPCYFIFGDSLVDNGNNNGIASLARANYPPYGVDFPDGPTGRFSNGLTTVDVIAQLLGFDDFIPPFASARGEALLTGVNFASAAAGIRDETGQQFGARISFNGQLQNYQSAVQELASILGDEDSSANYLSKCIFSVGMGSNDYLNNYFMPMIYSTSRRYNPDRYAEALIHQYSQQLKILYNFGARKVALMGVGQVGCSPNELAQFSPNGVACVDGIDSAIQLFNRRLAALVDELNKLEGAHFTYINTSDMLRDPAALGFKVNNTGCCGVGKNNGQATCLPYETPCQNRDEYLFWDAFHLTEAANIIIGKRSYSAQSPSDAYPMDIRHLAHI